MKLIVISARFADVEADQGLKPPAGHSGPTPAGLAFAKWLRDSLPTALEGIGVGEFPWVTYSGHGIELNYAGARFDLVVELTDREAATWSVTLEPRKGFVPFRRKAKAAGFEALSERLRLYLSGVEAIDEVSET